MSDETFFYGYYVSLDKTNEPAVDRVLQAVARACRAYHHTEGWREVDEDDGLSHVDRIQASAKASADEVAQLRARVAELEAENERLSEPIGRRVGPVVVHLPEGRTAAVVQDNAFITDQPPSPKPTRRQVTKAEFEAFVAAYPRELKRDCFMDTCTYNDFTIGSWPESIVAGFSLPYGDDPERGWFVVAPRTGDAR